LGDSVARPKAASPPCAAAAAIGRGLRFQEFPMDANLVIAAAVAAIRAACAETGASPLDVFDGGSDSRVGTSAQEPRSLPIARARVYAGVVLREALPIETWSNPNVARLVGSRYPAVFINNTMNDLRRGLIRWWNAEAADRVGAAVAAVLSVDVPSFPPKEN